MADHRPLFDLSRLPRIPKPGDRVSASVRGVRGQHLVIDEVLVDHEVSPVTREIRRQLGDTWDGTPAGVFLPPLALGTFVEVYDLQCDMTVLGQVVERIVESTTSYKVRTEVGAVLLVGREEMSVLDLESVEGIQDFLDGDKPKTAEEILRYLEGEGG